MSGTGTTPQSRDARILPGETPRVVAVARIFEKALPYERAMSLQEELARKRLEDAIPDTVLLLEHAPVITLGVAADAANLRSPAAVLAGRGVALARATRGGDVTYHGPGQLVVYPILKLAGAERDAHAYMRRLEETAILTAAAFGVRAWRRPGLTGVWTDAGKLAAIGIRIRRWVTSHGLSFNVAPDPEGFRHIVPCGLADEEVTSLRDLLPAEDLPDMDAVRTAWLKAFETVFRRKVE